MTPEKIIQNKAMEYLKKLEKEGMGQLIGEILWYKKVLYTNGIEKTKYTIIHKTANNIK